MASNDAWTHSKISHQVENVTMNNRVRRKVLLVHQHKENRVRDWR